MLKFIEIKDVNHNDFKKAMKIYTESFPPNERQPVCTVRKRVKERLYRMFVGTLENKVVFMALLYPLKGTKFILLDYMATDTTFRNKGIGAKFVKNLLSELKDDISKEHIILEVENPKHGDNKENRKRRIEFYKRLGAREIKNVRYVLPPLSGNTPTKMMLMILSKSNNKRTIDGNLVKRLITQIYRELYNRGKTDIFLNSFIHQVGDSVEII
jgi:GNAT superfamily N-acetyltransferase